MFGFEESLRTFNQNEGVLVWTKAVIPQGIGWPGYVGDNLRLRRDPPVPPKPGRPLYFPSVTGPVISQISGEGQVSMGYGIYRRGREGGGARALRRRPSDPSLSPALPCSCPQPSTQPSSKTSDVPPIPSPVPPSSSTLS